MATIDRAALISKGAIAPKEFKLTYEEYICLQEKRKAKPSAQPHIVVTQDIKGNVVITITLPPP